MIVKVDWQYILLTADPGGYRVKRRTSGPPPLVGSGTDTPMSDNWVSLPAPPQIHYVPDNKDYIFAFWSLTAHDSQSLQGSAQIQTATTANDSHSGGLWTISAKAYYVWNFGAGPGDNALLIDAFDVQAGDFIPDDFVDAAPDPNGKLTIEANNGYIDTSTEIAQGAALKVTARDTIPTKKFAYWLNIAPLMFSADPKNPATVGSPDPHDIVVHLSDIVVAFAFYNEVKQSLRIPPGSEYLYNPWWWIETLGGLVPPPPRDPWAQELGAVLALSGVANRVSRPLRAKVLEIALEQISIAAAALKQQIRNAKEAE